MTDQSEQDTLSDPEFTLTVLGCSGTYADSGGAGTGYLLRSPEATVWHDCGPGTLGNLQRHVPLAALDAVVISHSHPDHWVELPVLFNALRYDLGIAGLDVYLTAETKELAQNVIGQPESPTLRFQVIDQWSTMCIGDQSWSFVLADHPVETLASRVRACDRTFVFSADTGPAFDIAPFGTGIDLFLCEATFGSDMESETAPHLSARQAGMLAKRGGVERLMLTHLLPGTDGPNHLHEAERAYGSPVEQAMVGRTYAI
jgi:ribonuclease BN (tRNA processing enzyme)